MNQTKKRVQIVTEIYIYFTKDFQDCPKNFFAAEAFAVVVAAADPFPCQRIDFASGSWLFGSSSYSYLVAG